MWYVCCFQFSVACWFGCIHSLQQLLLTMYCACVHVYYDISSIGFDRRTESCVFNDVFIYIYCFLIMGVVYSRANMNTGCCIGQKMLLTAAGTYLPRLHLSESALLCKSHSYWIDSFLAKMFTAWIKTEFLS